MNEALPSVSDSREICHAPVHDELHAWPCLFKAACAWHQRAKEKIHGGQAACGLESSHHAAPSTRAPPPRTSWAPQRSPVNLEGASVTLGSVRERRLKMQRRWPAMQANLARLHRMPRSSDAGGNGRRYGEERGSVQENSPGRFVQTVHPRVTSHVWPRYEYQLPEPSVLQAPSPCRVRCRLFVRLAPARR